MECWSRLIEKKKKEKRIETKEDTRKEKKRIEKNENTKRKGKTRAKINRNKYAKVIGE